MGKQQRILRDSGSVYKGPRVARCGVTQNWELTRLLVDRKIGGG